MVSILMKKLIIGATGSIGSSLAKKLVENGDQVHLVGREEASLSSLASELNSSFTTCDVLEENFCEKILNDLKDEPIDGLAFCVGSIDIFTLIVLLIRPKRKTVEDNNILVNMIFIGLLISSLNVIFRY